jgi:glycosyltransferase involved in cell wall biosynthesis
MRTAIIHPWFLFLGGGERVTEVLAGIFPKADLFTLFADERFIPETLKRRNVKCSFLDRIPGKQRLYRQLLPLHALAAESFDLRGYDLIISSDSSVTKGVRPDQDALHISYCHTPTRYVWDYYQTFYETRPFLLRPFFASTTHYLRIWDYLAAQRVDQFIANSRYIARRIHRYYRRDSTVIYPPVRTASGFIADRVDDYYLSVGRLTYTKRLDVLIAACNRLRRRFVIAGVGRDESRLKRLAGPTIEFLGRVPDSALPGLYSQCRAFLFAADEDFGMVPIEAQAYGRPVIAYRYGGSLETVRGYGHPAPTGLFFSSQTADHAAAAILDFEQRQEAFDPVRIRAHALTFDVSRFEVRIKTFVESALSARNNSPGYNDCLASDCPPLDCAQEVCG